MISKRDPAFEAMVLAGERRLPPLAIAVIGGVPASLILSLIVTPTVHFFIAGRKHSA